MQRCMFKASRPLLAKLPVRPVVNAGAKAAKMRPEAGAEPPKPGQKSGFQVTPIGLAFIVGSLFFGVYLFKPNSRMPVAAMDTFKPQIAIIFGYGDSHESFKLAAEKLGFAYINVQTDMQRLDQLVNNGSTKFFIEGFKSSEQLENMAHNTVQPDAILNFEKSNPSNSREMYVPKPSLEKIEEIITQKNFV